MTLPPPLETVWMELEAVRPEILGEVAGLSQAQSDWRSSPADWSIGEILHHLTLAEIATGKLTSKLLRETPDAGGFPVDLAVLAAPPPWPPGPREAPPVVRPEGGHSLDGLVRDLLQSRRADVGERVCSPPQKYVPHRKPGIACRGQ